MSTALALRPADQRGVTTVADRVVEQIAVQAATEVSGTGSAGTRVLGRTIRQADATARPKVRLELSDGVAHVDLTLSLRWGAEVAAQVAEVREHVTAQLDRLAGVRTSGVDVHVTAFHTGAVGPRVA